MDNFPSYFKSVQSSTFGKMTPGRKFDSRPGHENFLCPRASMVSFPSSLKMFTGSVCVLPASKSSKSLKIKMKLINSNHEVREKKTKWRVKGKWRRLILLFFLWSELIRVQFYFIFIFLFNSSWSGPDWWSELIRSDFCTCLAKKCSFVQCRKYHTSWLKWCRRASRLGRFTLWNNGRRRATQLGRFTLWHLRPPSYTTQ